MTFAYPETPSQENQEAALSLFMSLRHMIPCGDCCGHYCSEIRKSPPQVQSRDSLSRWLVDLHNSVNARLGKPMHSYEAAKREYLADESQCLLPSEPCGIDSRAPLPLKTQSAVRQYAGILMCLAIIAALGFAFSLQRRRAPTAPANKVAV